MLTLDDVSMVVIDSAMFLCNVPQSSAMFRCSAGQVTLRRRNSVTTLHSLAGDADDDADIEDDRRTSRVSRRPLADSHHQRRAAGHISP